MNAKRLCRPYPRVLCVDDEHTLREVLALNLRRHGYEVETAPDGLHAWHLIREKPAHFDVVVTDNQMPHLTGFELVKRLRETGFAGGIVFFSSTLPATSAERLDRLQVIVVEKGRPVPELMAAVQRAADREGAS